MACNCRGGPSCCRNAGMLYPSLLISDEQTVTTFRLQAPLVIAFAIGRMVAKQNTYTAAPVGDLA